MATLASGCLMLYGILLSNRLMVFKLRSQHSLPSLLFWGDWKTKMAALASDWLNFFDFSSASSEWNFGDKNCRLHFLTTYLQKCEAKFYKLSTWSSVDFVVKPFKTSLYPKCTCVYPTISCTLFIFNGIICHVEPDTFTHEKVLLRWRVLLHNLTEQTGQKLNY